jgi:hypothetical protein
VPEDANAEVSVVVDGATWRWVGDLAAAGPDEAVFALDPETEVVVFGDGVHGRRPSVGARINVSYRNGGGSAGNVHVKVSARAPHLQPLERSRYFGGALLTPEEFQAEQDYHRGRGRVRPAGGARSSAASRCTSRSRWSHPS